MVYIGRRYQFEYDKILVTSPSISTAEFLTCAEKPLEELLNFSVFDYNIDKSVHFLYSVLLLSSSK
jgi:hypothetical protein